MTKHKTGHSTSAKKNHSGANAHKQQVSASSSKRAADRPNKLEPRQYVIAAMIIAGAFVGAYSVAHAGRGAAVVPAPAASAEAGAAVSTPGVARIENGVQKISVQVGFKYSPDVIRLKAGVPAEITFGEGQGCTAVVQSQDLGFQEDLSGGPKTVKLQGLQPGTYGFACGMNMVTGQVVIS